MQFKSDGTLKIMQITDMQEIPAISPDTLALLDAAVEAEHPDLVIYTGDQIKGYGVTYKGKTKKELEAAVAKTITALLEPVTRRHIPFAVTFGNHDRQVGISNADQFNDIYKSLPGCIGEQAEGIPGGVPGPAHHAHLHRRAGAGHLWFYGPLGDPVRSAGERDDHGKV